MSRVNEWIERTRARVHRGRQRVKWNLLKRFKGDGAIVTTPFGARLRLDFANVSAPFFWSGRYEPDETAVLRERVRPGATVCDVGANVGYFTLMLASLVGPSGRVVAVEANPSMAELLRRNLDLNPELGRRVTIETRALGAAPGTADFFCPVRGHEGVGGLRDTKRAALGRVVQVPVVRFDDVVRDHGLDRLDVMKIDIEGGERDLFRGARSTLSALRPVLLFEGSPQNTKAWGYTVDELLRDVRAAGYGVTPLPGEESWVGLPDPVSK